RRPPPDGGTGGAGGAGGAHRTGGLRAGPRRPGLAVRRWTVSRPQPPAAARSRRPPWGPAPSVAVGPVPAPSVAVGPRALGRRGSSSRRSPWVPEPSAAARPRAVAVVRAGGWAPGQQQGPGRVS